ncbi:MAG TPA: hypothetical protein VNC50_22040, partial [Planctomycetia bacterium]|nr:hypothetical protein [Planctomycetia bacterium]
MRITGCLAAALLAVSFAAAADSKADRQVLEKKFIDTLTECQMEGSFTIDGSKRPPASDKYTIAGVRKIGGDDWLIEARIQYMKHDVTLPVPVKVLWAGVAVAVDEEAGGEGAEAGECDVGEAD